MSLKSIIPFSRSLRFFKLFTPLLILGSSAWLAFGDKKQNARPERVGWIEPVQKNIEGWTVHVDPALLENGEHAEKGEKALKNARQPPSAHLHSPPQRATRQNTKDGNLARKQTPRAHRNAISPGAGWLKDRGYDPRLAKKVHITNASALFSRDQMLKHPAVILHELAHAYHDQVLGFGEQTIIASYDAAMKKGILERVKLFTGRIVRHYGATNHKEYFAEATEAYLYRNDFYPFVAAELKEHDPKAFAVMKKIWGPAAVQ